MLKLYSRNIILRARAFTDRFSLATEERIKNLYENGTQRVGGVCEWGQFVLLPIAVKKNIGWTGGIYSLQTQSVILKYLHRRKDDRGNTNLINVQGERKKGLP